MQRVLELEATFSKGKGYKKDDLVSTGIPIILYGEMYTNYKEFINEASTFIEDNNHADSIKSTGNEVIIPSSGESPDDIARASSVKVKGMILGGDLNIIYPSNNINPDFLALTISNGKTKRNLISKAQGSSITHIYNSDIKKIDVLFPFLSEQSKIVKIIELINNVITLEQEKNRKLELIKKELTGTLYATSNSIPILRFNSFNKPWRKQPLSNALKIKNIRKPVNAEYPLMSFTSTDGITPKGQRYDRSFLVKNSNKKYKRTNYTDVIYSSNNLDVGAIGLNSYGKASISDVYEIFEVQKGYNPNFISTLIKEPSELNKILKYRQGALYGQYKIYPEDFLKIKSYFPSTEEQVIISTFLNKINVQISNNNKKIDKYLLIKKVLLKNLFI